MPKIEVLTQPVKCPIKLETNVAEPQDCPGWLKFIANGEDQQKISGKAVVYECSYCGALFTVIDDE